MVRYIKSKSTLDTIMRLYSCKLVTTDDFVGKVEEHYSLFATVIQKHPFVSLALLAPEPQLDSGRFHFSAVVGKSLGCIWPFQLRFDFPTKICN